jgi:hypothetical protein
MIGVIGLLAEAVTARPVVLESKHVLATYEHLLETEELVTKLVIPQKKKIVI